MDRRQRKTREAIFSAFSQLIRARKYESITVQDIIDKADIGRSTFYSHFETKDHLLKAICSDIFEHIIVGEDCDYKENPTLCPQGLPTFCGISTAKRLKSEAYLHRRAAIFFSDT